MKLVYYWINPNKFFRKLVYYCVPLEHTLVKSKLIYVQQYMMGKVTYCSLQRLDGAHCTFHGLDQPID